MNEQERASQLSAMFDGELPAAECELLSRRLARDEQLRATWSRYAVIGAVLRAEPLAPVRPDFARRVSAALVRGPAPGVRRAMRSAALGSVIAAGVAAVAIMMLRNGLPVQDPVLTAAVPKASRAKAPISFMTTVNGGVNLRMNDAVAANANHEMFSYVVPPSLSNPTSGAVPAALADYVVAHSETPSALARGSLLSVLVGSQPVESEPDFTAGDAGH